jgi:hypothetical protein
VAPGYQGLRGGGGPAGGGTDGIGAFAVLAVDEQHGVAVRGRLDGVGQCVGRGRVAAADLQDDGEQRIHRLPGALQLGMAALVQTRVEDRVEERALLGGEPDVRPGHRGQPLRRGIRGVGGLAKPGREIIQGAGRHGGEQLVAVGEVPVRGRRGHAEAAGRLGQREAADPAFGYDGDGRVDQRGPQVAVVITSPLGWHAINLGRRS